MTAPGARSPVSEPAARREPRPLELRIALVLYGGVSLAVYENGVTRAFHDLVRENGVFGPLAKLLEIDPVVDVISGTSAGGINGLLLATALECGTDFAGTADLWRRDGDLGRLLRPIDEAENAESLLSGTYYQAQLAEAFKSLLNETESTYPSEMDVFLTGTSLPGATWTWTDGLGGTVEERNHRVLFQLKYRPGRRRLGLPQDARQEPAKRAAALASLARITSSFPIAFPPFRLADIPDPETQTAVGAALEVAMRRAGTLEMAKDELIDGGVLHNKPFEPALEAIFQRMPKGRRVQRVLFFVDPDPDQITPATANGDAPSRTGPIGVGTKALATIPSYQSIREALDELEAHNRLVQAVARVRAAARVPGARAGESLSYLQIRRDILALYLAGDGDDAPSLRTKVDPSRLEAARDVIGIAGLAALRPFDAPFHQRRTAFVLYELFEREHKPFKAIAAVAGVFELLEIIFARQIRLRNERYDPKAGADPANPSTIRDLVGAMSRWLRSSSWTEILDAGQGPQRLERLLSPEGRAAARRIAPDDPAATEARRSILEVLEEFVDEIANAEGVAVETFEAVDEAVLPMQFAAGSYCLDVITPVRVNPSSAQKALSNRPGADKVTGDDLAHFAAFFRRDWRSNDVTWGRLDGTCRILEALLPDGPGAAARLQKLKGSHPAWLDELKARFGQAATARARSAWNENANSEFRDALIELEQQRALLDSASRVQADTLWQDATWRTKGNPQPPKDVTEWALRQVPESPDLLEALATVAVDSKDQDYVDAFLRARRGRETVLGRNGRVPHSVLTQYATQAYLLMWGMVERSIGGQGNGSRGLGPVKAFLRHPVELIHRVVTLARRDRALLDILLWTAATLQVGAGIACYRLERPWLAVALGLTTAATIWYGRLLRQPLRALLALGLIGVTAIVAGRALPDLLNAAALLLNDFASWLRSHVP